MNNQRLAGLWIDTEKAIVAKNHDAQSASEFFLCNPVKHEIQHGNSNEHTGNNAEQTNKRKYFKEISELLVNTEKVLITGPGTIQEELKSHQFQERNVAPNSEIYYKQLRNRIDHPIPSKDRGNRKLDVLTDLNHLTEYQLASALISVDDNAINAFFQTVRRRLSILERPLVTARGDGKSYINANFNPKYSQMAITILRTYYNFCLSFKANGKNGALDVSRKFSNGT